MRLPVAQMVVLDPKARWNTGGGFIPLCGKGSFSQCQLLEQTIMVFIQSHVQPYALPLVHTFKILNTGSHTIVWTQENTAHTDRKGYR